MCHPSLWGTIRQRHKGSEDVGEEREGVGGCSGKEGRWFIIERYFEYLQSNVHRMVKIAIAVNYLLTHPIRLHPLQCITTRSYSSHLIGINDMDHSNHFLSISESTEGVSTISVLASFRFSSSFLAFEFHRKRQPMVMSQTILSPPAIRKGQENSTDSTGLFMKQPLMPRPKTSPTDLAMLVMPLAADLSSLETTMVTQVWRAGTSIWEMQKRAKRRMMLTVGLEVKAMSTRKTLEGRWVQIMVAMAPMRSTSLEESTPLMPLTMLHTKSTPPILSKCRSYFISQQQEMKDCTTKAPAKASREKRLLSVMMVPQFSLRMPEQVMIFFSFSSCGSISLRFIRQQPMNLSPPSSAYILTMFLVASSLEYPKFSVLWVMKKPAKTAPAAWEMQPIMLQQPKTAEVCLATSSLLSEQSSMSCERADCSMGMKGPIYPPETEITPRMPLTTRMMALSDSAQQSPVSSLRSAPNMRVLILPMRSAWVVRTRETSTSPKTMPDCIQLLSSVVSPLQRRLSKKMRESMPQLNILMILVRNSSTKSRHFCWQLSPISSNLIKSYYTYSLLITTTCTTNQPTRHSRHAARGGRARDEQRKSINIISF